MKNFTLKIWILLTVMFSMGLKVQSQTTGDLAILGVNTDYQNTFIVVALSNLPQDTVITFTNNPWVNANSAFETTVGYIQWTVGSGGVAAGTTVTFSNLSNWASTNGTVTTNGLFALSNNYGDHVIAFRGNWNNRPVSGTDSKFLWAFSMSNFSYAASIYTTDCPAALTSFSTALNTTSSHYDDSYFANSYYSGPITSLTLTGTKHQFINAIRQGTTKYRSSQLIAAFPTYNFTIVTNADSAHHFTFVNFPATGYPNTNLNTFTVEVRNSSEAIVPSFFGDVVINKQSGPGDVNWANSSNFTNGVASFGYLTLSSAGTYILTASAPFMNNGISSSIVIDPSTISLITPDGGEVWPQGSVQEIKWSAIGVTAAYLEYKIDNSYWQGINEVSEGTSYFWTVPSTPSTQCVVRVSALSDNTVVDTSYAYFTISGSLTPSITVIAPNGAENWQIGTTHNITWDATDVPNVNITLVNGPMSSTIIQNYSSAFGSYSWTIPPTVTPGTQYQIWVQQVGSSVYDNSNAYFTISAPQQIASLASVTPTSAEQGQTLNVTITGNNTSFNQGSSTQVWLKQGSATTIYASYINAASSTQVSGSFSFSNQHPIGLYDMYVSDATDGTLILPNAFTLLAPQSTLALTSPDGGESWEVGSVHNITWTSTNVNMVVFYLSTDAGTTWTMFNDAQASAGSFAWTIPADISPNCLIKIEDGSNNALFDVSNGRFSIVAAPVSGSLTIISPNGGEIYNSNSQHVIYWEGTNVSDNLSLAYTINAGTSWTIIANGLANSGNFNWTIPNILPTGNCLVKVYDATTPSVRDSSDSRFSIAAAGTTGITVTVPNGQETWLVNSGQDIMWTYNSTTTNVKLEYSTNNGANWNLITASTPVSSGTPGNGSYFWDGVANSPSIHCKIKVTDATNSTIRDISDNVFSIVNPTITVLSPNGGEIWVSAAQQEITWNVVGDVFYVDLEYSTNNGSTWSTISTFEQNTGSFLWTVPNTPSYYCLVKVFDSNNSSLSDASNSVFRIATTYNPTITLTAPAGSEQWIVNSQHIISWTSTDVPNVNIEYTTNGGSSWISIAANVTNYGSFAWMIPNTPAAMCQVKVSDASNGMVQSMNTNYFTIVAQQLIASLVSVSPSSATQGQTLSVTISGDNTHFAQGTSTTPVWFQQGTGTTIYPSNTNFQSATQLSSSFSFSTQHPTGLYDVYVYNSTDGTLMLPNAFYLSALQTSLSLNTPNGGESWLAGHTYNILWSSSNVNNVKIEYSTDAGASWSNVVLSTPAAQGSYSWTIPQGIQTKYGRVRISDASNASTTDMSANNFYIEIRTISLLTPNGGEVITGGSNYNITWNQAGMVYYTRLFYSLNYGQTWTNITNTASNGSYTWAVPTTPSTSCLIRIEDNMYAIVSDTSNQVFTIQTAPAQIVSVSPNSGTQGQTLSVAISGSNTHFGQGTGTTQVWFQQGTSTIINANNVSAQSNTLINGTFSFTTQHPTGYYNAYTSNATDGILTKPNAFYLQQLVLAVTVTSPNGGETWTAGSNRNITWTSTGIANVRIEFSANGGASWQDVVSNAQSTGSYNWTLPLINSQNCKIRISDVMNQSVSDMSNNVFSIIIPNITVTAPIGGESWTGGTQQQIKWTSLGASNYVNIDFSTNSGTTWTTISNGAYNNGVYYWNVPNLASANSLVRVRDYYTPTIGDTSAAVFTILPTHPSVNLTYPNGGETWVSGTTQTIYWSSVNVSNVSIDYSIDNGTTWTVIVASVAVIDGIYNWTIPTLSTSQAKIRITDLDNAGVTDMSNNVFTILNPTLTLTAPNGAETWTGGTAQIITWNSNDVSNVTLQYSLDNGSSWTNIANGIANVDSYSWTVPNTPSTQCLVKVIDYSHTNINDASDASFIIDQTPPAITVTTPNGGETLTSGTSSNIYWTSVSVNAVKIEYSTNNGGSWSSIIANTPASSGYFSWMVPATASGQCLVRITDVNNALITDVSNNVFNIVVPIITVTSPNGNETWVGGSTHAITWTSQNVSNYVTLEYSINNGSTWYNIYNGLSNTGTYNWSVPNNPSTSCLVRVKNYYNASVFDVSNDVFTITSTPAALTLNTPNGGQNLAVGTTQSISWTSVSINNVKIEYSINNGTDWVVIAASTPASNGSYSWVVPNTPSTQCFVKVTDFDNALMTDQSNTLFSIVVPVITVIAPNDGETWTGGEYHDITWTSNFSSNYVTIELSTNNGTSWSTLSSYEYNDGLYNWQIPNISSTQCLIRVKDSYTPTLLDISDAIFTINQTPPAITVTAPNGFETWMINSTQNISWSSISVSNVKIEYSTNNGTSWVTIISNTPAAAGYYSWAVPNTPSANCLIRVSSTADALVNDVSNNKFNIAAPVITVISPNGGESWVGATYHNITWTSSNTSSYVSIDYSIDNGSSWMNIVTQTYNDGSHNWLIPNTPSTVALIRVKDYYNSTISDESNEVFTLLPTPPSVTVAYPNGYENLLAGSTVQITWNYLNVNDINLEYTIDNGTTWNSIATGVSSSSGFYPWVVPAVTSTNCKIRITDLANAAISDVSNNLFTITTPYITVTSPNGGQQWGVGSTKSITWNSAGVQNVRIEYSFNNGASWTMITTSTSNTGTYSWTIPNTPSSTCRVRVRDVANLSIFDVSDNVFAIPFPTITLSVPNGGQQWSVGSTQNIYWSSTSVANVKLEYTTDGSAWTTIIASTPATAGSYAWVIPSTPSATCKVRASNVLIASVNDVSENDFAIITPSITVTSPAGGELWMAGSTQNITWTSLGASSYVKIEYSTNSGSTWANVDSYEFNDGAFSWVVPSTPSANCLVKVTDINNATISGANAVAFEITIAQPEVTLTSPNGGQSWGIGSQHAITWTALNITNVKLEYSFNNGSSWQTITASTPAAAGTYAWTIPSTPSVNCKVRIRDISNPSIFDASDNVFAIPFPTITVSTPNGGESWGSGSVHTIYWTSVSVPNVNIDYTIDGGTTWSPIVASVPSTGSYSWTVPATPSVNCKVRVSHATIANVKDISNSIFAITAPSIALTSPNGGEQWTGLSFKNINWTSTGLSNYVSLEYSINDGLTWSEIAASTPNSGSYSWEVPNVATSTCLVKVKDFNDSSMYDESNAVFSIVQTNPTISLTSPNGGENWLTGSSNYIYWSSVAVSNVKIEYTINDTLWTVISNSTVANAGSFYWNVPNTPSATCKVRVSDAANASISNNSNAYFSISQPIPTLSVTSPNGGEIWTVGDFKNITWSSNVVQNVKIDITYNGGTSWTTIVASTPAASGSYYYNVSNTPSINCKIRVRDVSNPSLWDMSNAVFRIQAPVVNNNQVYVDSILPNALCKGDTLKVYYRATGQFDAGNQFKVQLSTASGSFSTPTEIGAITSQNLTGVVNAVIPQVISNGSAYKVRVLSTNLFKVGTASDSTITINSPEFDFTANETLRYLPNGDVHCFYQGVDSNVTTAWEFGNGDTSTVKNPWYEYYDIGFYSVKLTVANSAGCVSTMLKNNFIDIEQIFPTIPNTPIDNNNMNAVAMANLFYGLTVGTNGSMFTTTNSGISWEAANSGTTLELTNIEIIDTANYYVTGTNGLVMNSTDRALSWTVIPTGTNEKLNAIAFNGQTNGWAVGENGTVLHFDGNIWTAESINGITENLNGVFIDTINNKVFVVGDNGSLFVKVGAAWSQVNTPVTSSLNDLCMYDVNYGLVAGANGTVLRTNNGGTTWDLTFSGISSSFRKVQIANADTAWVVGAHGVVYQTSDGGSTFDRFSIGDTVDLGGFCYVPAYLGSKSQNAGGRGVIVGKEGVAYSFGGTMISVEAPQELTICTGTQLSLSYFVTGTYNPGNMFTVELSDGFGDFSNPTIIGSVANTIRGTVTATIPATTPEGAGYKIRVNASDVFTTGLNSNFEMQIIPSPVVALGNDTSICVGSTLTLDANNPMNDVLWSNGDITQTTIVSVAATYSVAVTSPEGCVTNDQLVLSVASYPVVALGADTVICSNASITFDAGNAGSSFLWSTGETNQTITVATADTFAVVVLNPEGCASIDTLVLGVNIVAPVAITAPGFDTLCLTDPTLQLVATPANGTFSGTGVTGSIFDPNAAGQGLHSIIYTYTDANSCTDSDTLSLFVDPCLNNAERIFEESISVYPNPVTTTANIEFVLGKSESVSVQLYDGTGKLIQTLEPQRFINGTSTVSINTESLASGPYMIIIHKGSKVFERVIVK